MIAKELLINLYQVEKKSVSQIANQIKCSENKVNYWLQKHNIQKRSIANAQYVRLNPSGDPFAFVLPTNASEWFLYGLGLGLWWGEGNKVSKHAVRIGNTDSDLLRYFLRFLQQTYTIDESRLRFGLQIFSDTDPEDARRYWCRKLQIKKTAFHDKVVVTKSKKTGTYTKKCPYGVLTIYFSNTKIRDSIYNAIERLRDDSFVF